MWTIQAMGLKTVMTGSVWVVHDHDQVANQWAFGNMLRFQDKWGRVPSAEENSAPDAKTYRWEPPPLP
jgi:hypothetical protein